MIQGLGPKKCQALNQFDGKIAKYSMSDSWLFESAEHFINSSRVAELNVNHSLEKKPKYIVNTSLQP